jgi:hypothetical protein
MASRRLNSNRFFTTDYTEEAHSKAGMDWIDNNTLSAVLLRHYPALSPSLRGVENAYRRRNRVSVPKYRQIHAASRPPGHVSASVRPAWLGRWRKRLYERTVLHPGEAGLRTCRRKFGL